MEIADMRAHSSLFRIARATATPLLLLAAAPPAALALDYQVHGFAAQGYVLSEGNNRYGNSTGGGSFKFYEAGLNGTMSLRPDLLVSAQALVRDAGAVDNECLRLDYAQVDYRFLGTPMVNGGIRLGRVKNAFGLFNESRDVVFTRPGITLPHSVYLESQGFRRILFSSDGGQLYGGVTHGDYYSSLVVASSLNRTASEDEKRQLLPPGIGADIRFDGFFVARLQTETGAGNWRYALSYLQTEVGFDSTGAIPFNAEFDIRIYVLSLRHDAERFALSAEAQLLEFSSAANSSAFDNKGDGAYVQFDYRLHPQWTVSGRYDVSFSDRNDRNGREQQAASGRDRHSQFSRDLMVGLTWRPSAAWGVWSEFHLVDGTNSVSSADNRGRTLDNHWNNFLLMAAYRF
jgi:hypothetical protein